MHRYPHVYVCMYVSVYINIHTPLPPPSSSHHTPTHAYTCRLPNGQRNILDFKENESSEKKFIGRDYIRYNTRGLHFSEFSRGGKKREIFLSIRDGHSLRRICITPARYTTTRIDFYHTHTYTYTRISMR